VEGIGDHGCEYMTGGRIVILGSVGKNFAAGMSGGIAYVFDKDNDFEKRYNDEMVELFHVEDESDMTELKGMIANHFKYTQSRIAEDILNNFESSLPHFVKVYPNDYRRVVETSS
jgi:glutamate synthase (NADPH/NADH)